MKTASLLGLLFLFTTCPVLTGQSLQLRDGTVLVGKIEDVSEEGLTLRRLDNGGQLSLRWDHLSQRSAKLIKEREGLLIEKDEQVLVSADVITYMPAGVAKQEVVGKIVKQDDQHIYVRRRGSDIPIRRQTIRGRSRRDVSPTEIFTPAEYYQEVLQNFSPGEDADKHIAMAEHLVKVRDFKNAEVHYDKATELGNSKQPDLLGKKIERFKLLKKHAAEHALLDEIRTWLNRGNFKIANEKIEGFKANYPNSNFRAEFDKLVSKVDRLREKFLVKKIASTWYKLIAQYARSKGSDKKLTLEQAREYAQSQMGKDIRERIAKVLELELGEVDNLWQKRLDKAYKGFAKAEKYHYSVGSWMLGKQAIIKDTTLGKQATKDGEKKTKREQELERQIKRIREAIQRARRGNQGGNSGAKQMTPAAWWKSAERDQRVSWMKAFYAENSGDLEVVAAYLDNCHNCGGGGFISEMGSQGKPTKRKCPVCQSTQYKRIVRAR